MPIFLWTLAPWAVIIRLYRFPARQGNGVEQMGRKKTGDASEILNGRVRRPGSRVKASLAALQRTAERAEKPYGLFTTPDTCR